MVSVEAEEAGLHLLVHDAAAGMLRLAQALVKLVLVSAHLLLLLTELFVESHLAVTQDVLATRTVSRPAGQQCDAR